MVKGLSPQDAKKPPEGGLVWLAELPYHVLDRPQGVYMDP